MTLVISLKYLRFAHNNTKRNFKPSYAKKTKKAINYNLSSITNGTGAVNLFTSLKIRCSPSFILISKNSKPVPSNSKETGDPVSS